MALSMMRHSTRIALERNISCSVRLMSCCRQFVTMMTWSALFASSLMSRYTSRRRYTSLHWKSFVTRKKSSVACSAVKVSPCARGGGGRA